MAVTWRSWTSRMTSVRCRYGRRRRVVGARASRRLLGVALGQRGEIVAGWRAARGTGVGDAVVLGGEVHEVAYWLEDLDLEDRLAHDAAAVRAEHCDVMSCT